MRESVVSNVETANGNSPGGFSSFQPMKRTASEATWMGVHPITPTTTTTTTSQTDSNNFEAAKRLDEAEEKQLYEGCRSRTYIELVSVLQFLMKVTQQRLVSELEYAGNGSGSLVAEAHVTVEDQQQHHEHRSPPPLNNLLQVFPASHFFTGRVDPPKVESNGLLRAANEVSARNTRTMREYFVAGSWFLVAFLVRNYVLLKLAIMAALLSRRDYLRGHIELNMPQRNVTTSADCLCVLKEDIHLAGDNLARFKEHEKLTSWLQSLGAGFLSVPGLAALLTGVSSSLPITFFTSAVIYFCLRRVRADHLCFIFDPVGERRRIKHELDEIVRELIGSLSNWRTTGTHSGYKRRLSSQMSYSSQARETFVIAHDEQQMRLDRARFMQLLVLVNRLQLVKPYYATSEWHRKFVRLISRLIWLYLASICVTMTCLYACLILHDLYETTRLRAAELACRQWSPNGTQANMLDHAHLEPLDAPLALAAAYSSHDGSVLSLLKLAFTVEAADYFSLKRLVFIVELHFACLMFCLWSCQSAFLYASSLLNKIAWLRHLEEVFDLASKETAEHAKRTEDPTSRLVDSEDNLLKTLTVAYLHYKIFRRQEREFQVFVHCNLVRVVAFLANGCLILYMMALNVNTMNRVVLVYLYIVPFALINVFLLATSYKAKQVERIKRTIARIVAHCAASRSLQMSYALELWRRQLRSDHIEPDLLGKQISYESVIVFNAYAVASFLLMISRAKLADN